MSDAWNMAKDVVSGAGKVLGGTGDDPGILGLGKQDVDPYQINKSSFEDPHSGQMRAENTARRAAIDNRQAPTATAAQRTAVDTYTGAKVAPTERSQGVNLATAAQGHAAGANAATIDRGQEGAARAQQQSFVDALTRQATGQGPSLATMQLKQATDRNIKQQMGATAAMGGNPALAARNASLAASTANRQAGIDSAQMRIQEQLNAQQLLGGALNSLRGQDQSIATNQAGFLQQAALANAAAKDSMTQANMNALNQSRLQQGQMDLQNNQFNASAGNATSALQAQLQQQAGLASMDARNTMYGQNFQADQQTRLANLQSQLQTMGMNDAQIRFLLEQQLQQNERDRQANMSYEDMNVRQTVGLANPQVSAYQDSGAKRAEFVRNLTEQTVIDPGTGSAKKG